MSCAVFTFIGLYALITGKSNAWIIGASLTAAVFLFFFAAFFAWKEEHLARVEAEKRLDNPKPDIDGQIVDALIGPTYPFEKASPVSGHSVVLLTVKAWNKINMPDVSVKDYELKVTEPKTGKEYTGTQMGWVIFLSFPDTPGRRRMDIRKEALRPLRYMYPSEDFVGFYVSGLAYSGDVVADIELTLIDASDGRHTIKGKNMRLEHLRIEGLAKTF